MASDPKKSPRYVRGSSNRQRREGGSYHVRASLTQSFMWLLEMGRLPREYWPDGVSGVSKFAPPPDHFFNGPVGVRRIALSRAAVAL